MEEKIKMKIEQLNEEQRQLEEEIKHEYTLTNRFRMRSAKLEFISNICWGIYAIYFLFSCFEIFSINENSIINRMDIYINSLGKAKNPILILCLVILVIITFGYPALYILLAKKWDKNYNIIYNIDSALLVWKFNPDIKIPIYYKIENNTAFVEDKEHVKSKDDCYLIEVTKYEYSIPALNLLDGTFKTYENIKKEYKEKFDKINEEIEAVHHLDKLL